MHFSHPPSVRRTSPFYGERSQVPARRGRAGLLLFVLAAIVWLPGCISSGDPYAPAPSAAALAVYAEAVAAVDVASDAASDADDRVLVHPIGVREHANTIVIDLAIIAPDAGSMRFPSLFAETVAQSAGSMDIAIFDADGKPLRVRTWRQTFGRFGTNVNMPEFPTYWPSGERIVRHRRPAGTPAADQLSTTDTTTTPVPMPNWVIQPVPVRGGLNKGSQFRVELGEDVEDLVRRHVGYEGRTGVLTSRSIVVPRVDDKK